VSGCVNNSEFVFFSFHFSFSCRMTESFGVTVTVEKARLKVKSGLSKIDPYVQFCIDDDWHETKVYHHNTSISFLNEPVTNFSLF
jgi:hypothetical protein